MKIAILPGDGIGPEIVAQAVKVLEALRRNGLKIEMEQAPIGGAGYDVSGDPLPAATLGLAKRADAARWGPWAASATTTCRGPAARSRGCCASARNWDCLPTCGRSRCTRNWRVLPLSNPRWWQGWIS